ncbi:hypothetical protein HYH03_005368 [Edaphochlamys debaryana]|uniref:Glycerol-3-phosphate dehydrogenase [NAD(+)] n=1 Tax=Edaphochlamys debaryana TaxID=47281 RepID=A0A835Y5J8_9CHLO|nr:hypothetical protein HYH03_005368 [Edaphochlamys debaryana]|eukprot:KAG2496545.1 hypothetical protein HYH03_005368 [Edaphochlamys debaryana]
MMLHSHTLGRTVAGNSRSSSRVARCAPPPSAGVRPSSVAPSRLVATASSSVEVAVSDGNGKATEVHDAPSDIGNAAQSSAPATVETISLTEVLQKPPTDEALSLWRSADAVCFDVDCTITVNDGLDLLAEFMGCKEEVEELTNKAMDGVMPLNTSLEERLNLINCSPSDLRAFLKAHPPASRLAPGVRELIRTLQKRGVDIYLISGGFREILIPIASYLGIPMSRVFANRMNWQWDDETGEPTKLVGFDVSQLTAHNQGKPQAIARIRESNPYTTVVMVGDGITDLEAVQVSGGADLFIGYGGVVARPAVAEQAEWYTCDYSSLVSALSCYKVAVIGSGAWACAATRMIAQNTVGQGETASEFADEVRIWARSQHEAINETGENPVHFPGISLGPNVRAVASVEEAVADADLLVFCVPHQYVQRVCKQLLGKVKPGAKAISLTKGMRVTREGPQLISQMVRRSLGIDCCVLMGANIAEDVGAEQVSEAVIGYSDLESGEVFAKLFERPYFRVSLLPDPMGAELCGTLKNIVALGAGMVDGLDLGPNSKAAIIRQGLKEMRGFAQALFPSAVRDDTFLESCGVGDLVATCIGGRNRRVAEEWTRAALSGSPRSWSDLETDLLKGQKLQGVSTSNEVQEVLAARNWEQRFPLFTTINRIVNGHLPPSSVLDYKEGSRAPLVEEEEPLVLPRRNGGVAHWLQPLAAVAAATGFGNWE